MRRPSRFQADPAARVADRRVRGGFTLTELMVVILIIMLLSAAMIPVILPALNQRKVSEGSRLLQSEFARARDAAVRANAPRGFRLIPDPFNPADFPLNPLNPKRFTSSRLLPIEPAPDYSDGMIQRYSNPPIPMPGAPTLEQIANFAVFSTLAGSSPPYLTGGSTINQLAQAAQLLIVREVKFDDQTYPGIPVPSPPTSWFWNIRQGDKIQLNDTGRYYTVVGPMRIGPSANPSLAAPDNAMTNPERYINFGSTATYPTGPGAANFEFLILANGKDDPELAAPQGNGFTDEGFDGIDNDGDGIIDPGFNGVDDDGANGVDDVMEMFYNNNAGGYPGVVTDMSGNLTFPGPFQNEFEHESFQFGGRFTANVTTFGYTIARRPVPSEGGREILLPTNVVIDLTTSANSVPERSRVPIDPVTGFVDILIAPNGQILNAGATANLSPSVHLPFYHFWICEREDAVDAFPPLAPPSVRPFKLPMPKGTGGDPRIGAASYPTDLPALKGERRLLSINTRTGAIASTAIETFYVNNTSYPYEAAEAGVKDAQP